MNGKRPDKDGYWEKFDDDGNSEIVQVRMKKGTYRSFGNGTVIPIAWVPEHRWGIHIDLNRKSEQGERNTWPGEYPQGPGRYCYRHRGEIHVVPVKKTPGCKRLSFIFFGDGWDMKRFSKPEDWGPNVNELF